MSKMNGSNSNCQIIPKSLFRISVVSNVPQINGECNKYYLHSAVQHTLHADELTRVSARKAVAQSREAGARFPAAPAWTPRPFPELGVLQGAFFLTSGRSRSVVMSKSPLGESHPRGVSSADVVKTASSGKAGWASGNCGKCPRLGTSSPTFPRGWRGQALNNRNDWNW